MCSSSSTPGAAIEALD